MDNRSKELKALGEHAYRDIGIVVGIEGSDSSHAVVEVEFANSGVINSNVLIPARDLVGKGPLVIQSCVHADFIDETDRNPIPRWVTYMTSEELDDVAAWLNL